MHVGVSVRPREHALEVHVAVCLKYTSNCSGFGHNAGVNEPQPSIGSGPGGPAGDLMVSEAHFPLEPRLLPESLQRWTQVSDDAAAPFMKSLV